MDDQEPPNDTSLLNFPPNVASFLFAPSFFPSLSSSSLDKHYQDSTFSEVDIVIAKGLLADLSSYSHFPATISPFPPTHPSSLDLPLDLIPPKTPQFLADDLHSCLLIAKENTKAKLTSSQIPSDPPGTPSEPPVPPLKLSRKRRTPIDSNTPTSKRVSLNNGGNSGQDLAVQGLKEVLKHVLSNNSEVLIDKILIGINENLIENYQSIMIYLKKFKNLFSNFKSVSGFDFKFYFTITDVEHILNFLTELINKIEPTAQNSKFLIEFSNFAIFFATFSSMFYSDCQSFFNFDLITCIIDTSSFLIKKMIDLDSQIDCEIIPSFSELLHFISKIPPNYHDQFEIFASNLLNFITTFPKLSSQSRLFKSFSTLHHVILSLLKTFSISKTCLEGISTEFFSIISSIKTNQSGISIKLDVGSEVKEFSFLSYTIAIFPSFYWFDPTLAQNVSKMIGKILIEKLTNHENSDTATSSNHFDLLSELIELLSVPGLFSVITIIHFSLLFCLQELNSENLHYRVKQKLINFCGLYLKKCAILKKVAKIFDQKFVSNLTPDSESPSFCLCQSQEVDWIFCETCKSWYHVICFKIDQKYLIDDVDYTCQICENFDKVLKNIAPITDKLNELSRNDVISSKLSRHLSQSIFFFGFFKNAFTNFQLMEQSFLIVNHFRLLSMSLIDSIKNESKPNQKSKKKSKNVDDKLKIENLIDFVTQVFDNLISINQPRQSNLMDFNSELIFTLTTAQKEQSFSNLSNQILFQSFFQSFSDLFYAPSIFSDYTVQKLFSKILSFTINSPPSIKSFALKALLNSYSYFNNLSILMNDLDSSLIHFLNDDSPTVKTTILNFLSEKLIKMAENLDENSLENFSLFIRQLHAQITCQHVSVRSKILQIIKNMVKYLGKILKFPNIGKDFLEILLYFLRDTEDSVRDQSILILSELLFDPITESQQSKSTDIFSISFSFSNIDVNFSENSLLSRAFFLIFCSLQGLNLNLLKECVPESIISDGSSELVEKDQKMIDCFSLLSSTFINGFIIFKKITTPTIDHVILAKSILGVLLLFSNINGKILKNHVSDHFLTLLCSNYDPSINSHVETKRLSALGLELTVKLIPFLGFSRPTHVIARQLIDYSIKFALQEPILSSSSIFLAGKLIGSIISQSTVDLSFLVKHLTVIVNKLISFVDPSVKNLIDFGLFPVKFAHAMSSVDADVLIQRNSYPMTSPHRLLIACTSLILNCEFLRSDPHINVIIFCLHHVFLNLSRHLFDPQSFFQTASLVLPALEHVILTFPALWIWVSDQIFDLLSSSMSTVDHFAMSTLVINITSSMISSSHNLIDQSKDDDGSVGIVAKIFPKVKNLSVLNCDKSTISTINFWTSCLNFFDLITSFGLIIPVDVFPSILSYCFAPFHSNFELDTSSDDFQSFLSSTFELRTKAQSILSFLIGRFEPLVIGTIKSTVFYLIEKNVDNFDNPVNLDFLITSMIPIFHVFSTSRRLFRIFINEILNSALEKFDSEILQSFKVVSVLEILLKILVKLPYSTLDHVMYVCSRLIISQSIILNLIENFEKLLFLTDADGVSSSKVELSVENVDENLVLDFKARMFLLCFGAQSGLLKIYEISAEKLENYSENDPQKMYNAPVSIVENNQFSKIFENLDKIMKISIGNFDELYSELTKDGAFVCSKEIGKKKAPKKSKGQKSKVVSKSQRKKIDDDPDY
ncbi:hypothetical protein RCL1_003416 [Eukaryota sp. TZLM3-RCL]